MAECLIGLGSNLGNRAAQLDEACRLLCGHPQIRACQCSGFHATPPIGGPAGQDPFLNAVLSLDTSLPPIQLLAAVRDVEQQLGRQRHERWGPRVIDIDILLYDQQILDTDELVLPHPRMAVRRFVLAPACEVAPNMVHPATGWTIARLLQRLDQRPHYVAIAGTDAAQTAHLAVTAAHVAGARWLLDPAPPNCRAQPDGARAELAQRELQAVAARLAQLSGLPTHASRAATDWHVCSYWLPQSLAVARACLGGPAQRQLERACALAAEQMPLPHCIVFLAAAAAGVPSAADTESPGRTDTAECHTTAALHAELALQLSQPGQGPVLTIPGGDLRLALTELTAAIDAMR